MVCFLHHPLCLPSTFTLKIHLSLFPYLQTGSDNQCLPEPYEFLSPYYKAVFSNVSWSFATKHWNLYHLFSSSHGVSNLVNYLYMSVSVSCPNNCSLKISNHIIHIGRFTIPYLVPNKPEIHIFDKNTYK